MDKRDNLFQLLDKFKTSNNEEVESKLKIIEFIKSNPKCFDNDNLPGHITASALVVDKNLEFTLLVHHRALDFWLQPGGHSDSIPDVAFTAIREAREELGLKSLKFIPKYKGIFDIDIHKIPFNSKKNIPPHYHYDIRFILTANINEPYKISDTESTELKWIKLKDAEKYNQQPGFLKLIKKAKDLQK